MQAAHERMKAAYRRNASGCVLHYAGMQDAACCCSLHTGVCRLLQPACSSRRRRPAASCSRASTPGIDSCISMEVATLRATCSLHAARLHVDRIFKMQIVFFQMQPAFRSYYARMQPAYDGMQDAAGRSRLHASCRQPACRAHASLV